MIDHDRFSASKWELEVRQIKWPGVILKYGWTDGQIRTDKYGWTNGHSPPDSFSYRIAGTHSKREKRWSSTLQPCDLVFSTSFHLWPGKKEKTLSKEKNRYRKKMRKKEKELWWTEFPRHKNLGLRWSRASNTLDIDCVCTRHCT